MLTVIRSNRVEQLLAELARRLLAAPPASVFTPLTVVAPSPAMARWVNLNLASVCGIAANVHYPLPASFVWRLARALLDDLPDADPLSLDAMTWQVFAELPGLLPEPDFATLNAYLRDDADGRKRWQLAARIADVYDRCQLYRPELIRGWTDGDAQAGGEPWQARLWQRLIAGREGQQRVAMLDRLAATLANRADDRPPVAELLPERLALFAVSSLPPILVQVFQALAHHIPVDLYLHTPTDQFWSDLVSQKALARKRLAQPDDAELWEVGNPLLGSWGRQGQALQDLLLQQDTDPAEQDAHADDDWPPTLLGHLQQDLFALTPVPPPAERAPMPADDSVQIHLCHSPARECQVLHDALLAMFAAEPDLRPEEVLVMVPDIGRYAPDIEAVFDRHRLDAGGAEGPLDLAAGRDHGRPPFIPWNLSDIAVADEHPLVRVFLRLLLLPDSRFTQSEVLSYLDVPDLATHFGLDADAVEQIQDWLAAANLRWGLDGAHKLQLGLPDIAQNTWAQAEQRLFAGYALGGAGDFAGIAPVAGVEGTAAATLGSFWRFFDLLRGTARRLAEARPALDWQRDLVRLVADFFGERDDADGRLQRIRDALAEFAEEAGAVPEPLSLALVRAWLEDRLAGDSGERRGGRYFSGGVTFCGMRPMRSLPFKVICVLGLDDEAFPRRDRPVEFDPMRNAWRPGDPRKGDEDRYLFLETLLGARRRLYLSCVGRDIRSNQERQPSVLLRELLDHIDQYFTTAGGDTLSQAITRVHALQPFSRARFVTDAATATEGPPEDRRSFDADWCRVAQRMQDAQDADLAATATLAWPVEQLPPVEDTMREVTLAELERFLVHPVRRFVQTRLKVYLREEEPEPDDETFALGGLEGWALRGRLLQDHLAGQPTTEARLAAEGALPHGAFAPLALMRQQRRTEGLAAELADYVGRQPTRLDLDLRFDAAADLDAGGPWRLTGQVTGLYPGLGLLRWRPGKLRGEDRLRLWLAHLARWAALDSLGHPPADPPSETPEPSLMLAEETGFCLSEPLTGAKARAHLADLLALYWRGLHRPLPILPRASYAFAAKWQEDDERAQQHAWNAARRAWLGDSFNNIPGDGDDPDVQLVLRDATADPLDEPAFARLALALYQPLLAAGEDT